MKYSAIAAPVYGAMYCNVAGSFAFAATITVYDSAPFSVKVVIISATDDAF